MPKSQDGFLLCFFFHKLFEHPQGVRDIPAKLPVHPRFLPAKPKQDKLSRKGTNLSTTTTSRGRPPPHRVVSGKFYFCVLFSCLILRNSLSMERNGKYAKKTKHSKDARRQREQGNPPRRKARINRRNPKVDGEKGTAKRGWRKSDVVNCPGTRFFAQ